jgi:phospholipid/cholesterol/gamma-HCH transport system ATP-binding protein
MSDPVMSDPVVLKDVSLENKEETVLDGISLTFPGGSFTLVMGPSGSGKSVLLKVACGLIPPTRGAVEQFGRPLIGLSHREEVEVRRRTGFAFQDSALWQNMTVYQNLALPIRYHDPSIKDVHLRRRIYNLLEPYGMAAAHNSRPSDLSSGERKIVSYLRALMLEPEVLFLDEPLASVDSQAGRKITASIRELKSQGRTIVSASHSPQLASQMADYLLVLKDGRVLVFDRFDEVVRSNDREISSILTDVLSQAASYDGDILSLLDDAASEDSSEDSMEGLIDE